MSRAFCRGCGWSRKASGVFPGPPAHAALPTLTGRSSLALPADLTPGAHVPPTGRGPAPELSAAPSLPSVHTAPDTQCPAPNAHPPAGTWLDLSGILGQTQVSCRVESQIALSSEPLHGSLSEHQSRALSLALCPAHQAKPRPGSPEPCPAEPVLPGLARSSSPPPCPAHFCLVCLPPSCACRSPSPVHADRPSFR